jgi:hypothetical protein
MMRPNKFGWVIVGFFLVGGIVFYLTIPQVMIGQIWIVVALGLAGLYMYLEWRANRAGELRQRGTPGTATILDMTQTGMYINEMPQVRFKFRVEGRGMEPYEVNKTMTVPHIALGALTSGLPLQVFIDPKDRNNLFIDWFRLPAAGTFMISNNQGPPINIANPEAQQAVLEALKKHGIDPATGGSLDLRQVPAARAAVLEALRNHGIDVAHSTAAADPTTPIEETGAPLDRMAKLNELRSANLITEQEFEEQRKRILEGI